MSILQVKGLSHGFGEKELYREAGFSLNKGEHMGVTGPNGVGKSTLIRILTGELLPDGGEVVWQRGIRVGYLDQHAHLAAGETIWDYLRGAYEALYRQEERLNRLYQAMERGLTERESAEAANLQEALLQAGFYDAEHEIRRVANGLGLEAIGLERPLDQLSGGQREKVILARLLLEGPEALVMDEPTNYLDAPHIKWLTGYLKGFPGAFIVVSHDEDFLDGVTDCVVDLDAKTLTRYSGNLRAAMAQKERVREGRLREYQAQQKEIAALREYIDRNRVRAATARQAKSRQKRLDRMERVAAPESRRALKYDFPSLAEGAGLEMKGLVIGYDHPLLPPVSLALRPGEKLALTGFNGVGKTTLLRTLTGEIAALGGGFRFTGRAVIGYFEQESRWEMGEITPLQLLRAFYPDQHDRLLRARLAAFGIRADLCERPVSTLSGGEQAKVRLCVLSCRPCNFLLLDEPTSHLDSLARSALLEAVRRFPGSAILVSHEGEFLKEAADRVLTLRAPAAGVR